MGNAGQKGLAASVRLKPGGGSYLSDQCTYFLWQKLWCNTPHEGAAHCRFKISTGEFWYGGTGPIGSKTQAGNEPPLGTHDLEIPYEYHSLGSGYEGQSIFAGTWFRIGHSGDRFLHPGMVSAGCVTVTDVDVWTKIYNYLIAARKDTRSVGTITVEA